MSDRDEDAWVSLGAIAAQMMEKMAAPDTKGGDVSSAGAQATGVSRALHHDAGRRGAVVIQLFCGDRRVTSRPQGMHANRVHEQPAVVVAVAHMNTLAKRPARQRR